MTEDQKGRYPPAVESEKAKIAGVDTHPADKHRDPMNAVLADKRAAPAKATLKHIGGSDHDEFNIGIANSVMSASWVTSREERDRLVGPLGYALAAIAPTDELEGMIAAQMVAAHQASLESYRRAALPNQTVEGREVNLRFATKTSQTFGALLETLNRHRGKGNSQKVTVEHVHRHVHVHDSGAPFVGRGDTPGAGGNQKSEGQPHAQRAIEHAPQPALPSEDAPGEPVLRSGDAEREMSDARRREPRRAER